MCSAARKKINPQNIPMNKRVALSKMLLTQKAKVMRHLLDGDILIVNRQPTLHKPGMMAHKAKIIVSNDKCIRMHYANCAAYNADFDGDEINLHFVQNEIARSELYNIAITDNQYIVPTSGAPIRGLIQDHVASAVLLTKKDTFLTKDEFCEFLYGCIFHKMQHKKIMLIQPCILKPKPLWSGKQLVQMLMNFLFIYLFFLFFFTMKKLDPNDKTKINKLDNCFA